MLKRHLSNIHYGWFILVVAFFSIIVAAVIRSTSGVFMVPFEEEFGWERSTISLAFAVNLVLYGFSGPFVAAFMERYGVRKVMIAAMLFLAGGIGLTTVMSAPWQLFLLWGIIIGMGSGVFLSVLSAHVANHWFVKNRGLAIGILHASTATGQLLFLPSLAYIVEQYSWRTAATMVSALGLLMILVIFRFMKNDPADMGVLPYGASDADKLSETKDNRNPVATAFQTLHEAVRNKDFWLLAGSFFICGLSTSGLIGTHFIPYCSDFGISAVTAAGLLAFMGVFDIVGTTVSGWLSDRFDNRWLLFWYYGLRGLSLLLLPYALFNDSYLFLVAFAIFYGLDWVATVPPTIRLASDIFGKEKGAVVYGWIFASHQLGSGLAAYGGGVVYSWLFSYQSVFVMAGAMCLLATLFVLRIKRGTAVAQGVVNG